MRHTASVQTSPLSTLHSPLSTNALTSYLLPLFLFACSHGGGTGRQAERIAEGIDFGDTMKCHDMVYMERSLGGFMSRFPEESREGVSGGIRGVLEAAAADSVSFRIVTEVMDRYLSDPNSPLRNEDYYILYLKELLRLPVLTEDERARPEYQLTIAKKNRPGMAATDFTYTGRDGKRHTLRTTAPGRPLLLIFYDPECGHCSEILEQVAGSAILREKIEDGSLTVLAIYTEGKRKLWHGTKDSMPQEWTVGIDEDSIVDRELYSIPAMPVMYLLDGDRKVLLKDASLPEIEVRVERGEVKVNRASIL